MGFNHSAGEVGGDKWVSELGDYESSQLGLVSKTLPQGREVGWLAGWLVGWLVSWLAGGRSSLLRNISPKPLVFVKRKRHDQTVKGTALLREALKVEQR